ncbi:MAG: peptidoglycan DD-metalloendopeptidase family protein [bacterium]|nr:peptidoglycan DD-metalloendopeptidase family protein [bacterium]
MKDWTTAMTVVFLVVMSFVNVGFTAYVENVGIGSGKDFLRSSATYNAEAFVGDDAFDESAAAHGSTPIDIGIGGGNAPETRFIILDETALLNTTNPLSNIVPTRGGLIIYKIQKGDNLSGIAANFGISLNTILWANEEVRLRNVLKTGQEIIILPVTGVLHHIKENETLEIIAEDYGVGIDRIINANPQFSPSRIAVGETIIIPDSKPLQNAQYTSATNLPSIPGYFAIPTTGWNWGRLHNYNAVDIANACGTQVFAAAEGLVIESSQGWNQGYGNFIFIEHPNGTKTRYAHNSVNLVNVGDYVAKGDHIANIGNTGNTHGPTGCHLHLEIYNAKNPFAK